MCSKKSTHFLRTSLLKRRTIKLVPDTLTKEQRSKCMAANRGKNTTPERIVRSVLHSLGYRYRLHQATLPGKPDLVLPRLNIVVLIHGCFWHSHKCKRGRSTPSSNVAFWQKKRTGTVARDRRTIAALRRTGWRVLVVWECQIANRERLSERLHRFLNA